jgi:hypothetical protein
MALDVGGSEVEDSGSLDNLYRAVSLVESAPPEDQPFVAASLGEDLDRLLTWPTSLIHVAREVVRVALELGCASLMPASPIGDRISGASLVVANGALKIWDLETSGAVLVVDGLLVTGSQICAAGRSARAGGAARVAAVVVAAVGRPDLAPDVDLLAVVGD